MRILRAAAAALLLLAPPPKGQEADAPERRVMRLVNAEREAAGLRPLDWSAALAEAAARHSDSMAARGAVTHDGPDGGDVGDRAAAAGFRWRLVGENVAAGQPTPEEAVAGWMRSPGHRENILNPGFTATGVGRAAADDAYGVYWTQVFAAPRED